MSRKGAHVSESIQIPTSKLPKWSFLSLTTSWSLLSDRNLQQLLLPSQDQISLPHISNLVCSMKECVGSSLCRNDSGELFPRKTLASLTCYSIFWLETPVALWNCIPSYIKARDCVRDLVVVTDGAERGNMTLLIIYIILLLWCRNWLIERRTNPSFSFLLSVSLTTEVQ